MNLATRMTAHFSVLFVVGVPTDSLSTHAAALVSCGSPADAAPLHYLLGSMEGIYPTAPFLKSYFN